MVMTDGQDPDINEVYYLRDELVDMGEVFIDDSMLDIVLWKDSRMNACK